MLRAALRTLPPFRLQAAPFSSSISQVVTQHKQCWLRGGVTIPIKRSVIRRLTSPSSSSSSSSPSPSPLSQRIHSAFNSKWAFLVGGVIVLGISQVIAEEKTQSPLSPQQESIQQQQSLPNQSGTEPQPQPEKQTFCHYLLGLFPALETYFEGSTEPLLGNEFTDPYGNRKWTLVLGFEDTLVHVAWERQDGFRVRKRPHVDQFMHWIAMHDFEVTLWTGGMSQDTEPNVTAFDDQGSILHRLYGDQLNFSLCGLTYVKDLNRLNRDLARVIHIDSNQKLGGKQPANFLKISAFINNPDDKELKKLIEFLDKIRYYNVSDVRPFIQRYNEGLSIREIFKEAEEETRALVNKFLQKRSSTTPPSSLSSVFGVFSNVFNVLKRQKPEDKNK